MGTAQTDFNFRVANLGSVRAGAFTQKPLTIFCGPNNTGKTWALYSLYYFYQSLKAIKENWESEDAFMRYGFTLDRFNRLMSNALPWFFNTPEAQLAEAEFVLITDDDSLPYPKTTGDVDAFLMPAERSGLHLFFRELSTRRTARLHHASRENIDISELLRDVMRSPYAMPISDYIDWLNVLADRQKSKSKWGHSYAERLKRGLAGGAYSVDAHTSAIGFKPYRKRGDTRPSESLGLHITSSAVKSLFGLWFYLEHQAEAGNILMIDEPELNIHPENQRKIARLLARLVNGGIKVVISTHSDYIVREFNSLIMLGQDHSGELRQKHGYDADEVLQPDQVGAYLFDKRTINPFDITPSDGIYAITFDTVIEDLNDVNDDIYYSIKEYENDQDHS